MLSDLDTLMAARGIGAVVVPMHEATHASFRWLAHGAQVTRGYAIKKPSADPVLFTYAMERGEAEKSGLSVVLVTDKRGATPAVAYAELYGEMLGDVDGTIAFYGNVPVQLYLGVIEELERRGRRVHRSNGEDLIQLARKRKDAREISIIADVGERTEQVVDDVRAALRDFKPGLKIGDLKAIVREGILRRGLLEDHETILSHGRDAGVPHSRGNANDVIREGVPIVLDIFPLDRETGYFFDLTRTFCVGRPSGELHRIHADVLEAFERSRDTMKPGTPAIDYQNAVCDFFEAKGYATTRTNPATLDGYVHSLGHGVGLDIHEKPSFGLGATNLDVIEENDIVTIEPGLYFPDRELGVRIEDTFVVENGGVRTLCRGSYGLEA
ncbi:MAG TPA: Xaa-Pro peptidase family protein [Thermoanaerobaculia bacterium]|jgi:Xaa-Pro aminopeptidase